MNGLSTMTVTTTSIVHQMTLETSMMMVLLLITPTTMETFLKKRVTSTMNHMILIQVPTKANGVTQFPSLLLPATNAKLNFKTIVIIPTQWVRVAFIWDNKVQIPKMQKDYPFKSKRNYIIYLIKKFQQRVTLLEIMEFKYIYKAQKKFKFQTITQILSSLIKIQLEMLIQVQK